MRISSSNEDKEESSLRFVSMVLRHGNRAPLFTYPSDPYANRTIYWPEGEGELLNIGRRGLLKLGRFLRERYGSFLPSTFNASQVRTLSIEFNRCVESAECLLTGLYPPNGEHASHNLSCRSFPISVVPREEDDECIPDAPDIWRPCEKFVEEFKNALDSYVFKQVEKKLDVLDYVSDNIGQKLNVSLDGFYMMGALYDTLFAQSKAGLELPEWTKKVFPEELAFFINVLFSSMTQTPTQRRLNNGILINEILSTMEMRRSRGGAFNRLFDLFSATDLTIHSLWRSMGVRKTVPLPGYGATMIFELHEIAGNYFVKALYKNAAEDDELRTINFSGCENDEQHNQNNMCGLDTLRKLMENATITDLDKECQMSELSVHGTKEEFLWRTFGY
ncbi:lysosomal acid phosphatase [Bemisia tabaci]|uniref:lysosomal acid phosphatase n=1 Tax=Bemisia tabaci TaxID=7038 RepID=UPI003B2888F8